jgi:hypothetical protein
MAEYYTPQAEEFINDARLEFSFLSTEFGFEECKSILKHDNPVSIFFKKGKTFVYVEGLSYGCALGVNIGQIGHFQKIKERFSLGYVISFRNPELLEPTYPEKRGQLEDMKQSAMALRKCAKDFLNGDFTDLPNLKHHIKEVNAKEKHEYEVKELRDLGIKASRAFHSGNYENVVKLLQPIQNKLSSAQHLLLSQAQKRKSSDAASGD